MAKFKKGIFDLTPEQKELSKMIYNGKIIKFIIAPYSTYNDLEPLVPYTENTFLFPEREMNMEQIRGFVSMLVAKDTKEELIVFTKEQSIILDMVDGCVRIMDFRGQLHDCPCKTFMANIHTIRHEILENDTYAPTEEARNEMRGQVDDIIKKINEKTDSGERFDIYEYNALKMKIEVIGEQLIRGKLLEMLQLVGYKGSEAKSSFNFID